MTSHLARAALALVFVSSVFAGDKGTGPTVMRFARGEWDPEAWKPVRLANQARPRALIQLDGAIGTTATTFTATEYSAEEDNAVLVHDLGTTEAEVAITFMIGKGFNGCSAPGMCIAPVIKDGLVVSSIAVFAADYTTAVWYQDTAPDGKTVRYRHLVQLARRNDPERPHVLRCRVSKKEASVAICVDDSSVAVLSFVGNRQLSFVGQEVNSLIGLWGCHGACTFRSMRVDRPGTLPFLVRGPAPGGAR